MLIEKGADIYAPAGEKNGLTALQAAVEGGHTNLVKMLIEKGADVHAALRVAAEKGHTDLVRMLIEKGADVNTPTENGVVRLHWRQLQEEGILS
jgi:ankyrin repeat protein